MRTRILAFGCALAFLSCGDAARHPLAPPDPVPISGAAASARVAQSSAVAGHDFSGSDVDQDAWVINGPPGWVSQDDRLVVHPEPNVAASAGLLSAVAHAFAGTSASAEISQVAGGPGTTETYFGLISADQQEYVIITSFGGRLYAFYKWRGQSHRQLANHLNLHQINHRFRRIRESGGTVFFEVSADGQSWNRPGAWSVRHSLSDLSALHINLGVRTFDATNGTPIAAHFENINTTRPAIPRELAVVEYSHDWIDLVWQDAAVNESGFRVERSESDAAFTEIATVPPNTTQYRDSAVVAATSYEYRVRAFNAAGESAPSRVISATTSDMPPSDPPPEEPPPSEPPPGEPPPSEPPPEEPPPSEPPPEEPPPSEPPPEEPPPGEPPPSDPPPEEPPPSDPPPEEPPPSEPPPEEPPPPEPPPPPAPPPAVHTLIDEFAGQTVNESQWGYYDDPYRVAQDNRLAVTLSPNIAMGYGGLVSLEPHDLTASAYTVEVSQVASGDRYTETFMGVTTLDEEEYLTISSLNGRIGAYYKWRGENWRQLGSTLAFNPGSHRFRRIREQNGVVFFELSSNGTSWTRPSGWQVAHNLSDPAGMHPAFGAGTYYADPNPGVAIFENISTIVPAIPSDLAATVISSSRIDLAWHDRSSNESGFRIERREIEGVFALLGSVGANVRQYQDHTAQAGVLYEYRVRAWNAHGESAPSHSAIVATTLAGVAAVGPATMETRVAPVRRTARPIMTQRNRPVAP